MKTVKMDVTFEEKSGRLELFVRWLWAIPSYIVMMVLVIIACIANVIQWIHILLLGKKNKTLFEWTEKYIVYAYKFMSYFFLLTDERNPIFPEE